MKRARILQDDSPIRAIACLKKIDDIKRFEETDDCFILGFDPTDTTPNKDSDVKVSSKSLNKDADDDICVLAEKGKVRYDVLEIFLVFYFDGNPYCNL